MKVHEQCPSDR